MGHAVTLGLLSISALTSGLLWWAMVGINRRRRAGMEDWKMAGRTEEEIDEMGDDSPRYVYAT